MVKISDFGLARFLAEPEASALPKGGTPAFMAPEVLHAIGSLPISTACDIFALGATLFCMLVGSPPWMGATQLDLAGNLTKFELTFPSEIEPINPHLRHLLHRLLEKDPEERIQLRDVLIHEWVTAEGSEIILLDIKTCLVG